MWIPGIIVGAVMLVLGLVILLNTDATVRFFEGAARANPGQDPSMFTRGRVRAPAAVFVFIGVVFELVSIFGRSS
jgi:hypothetical protein